MKKWLSLILLTVFLVSITPTNYDHYSSDHNVNTYTKPDTGH
ncbi:hypothetical protein ABC345_03290 [Shouchella sp. 1P09AA]